MRRSCAPSLSVSRCRGLSAEKKLLRLLSRLLQQTLGAEAGPLLRHWCHGRRPGPTGDFAQSSVYFACSSRTPFLALRVEGSSHTSVSVLLRSHLSLGFTWLTKARRLQS